MRQKFIISRDYIQKKLRIAEYAIIEKHLTKVMSSMLQKEDFSFLCKETYESDMIINSIAKGMTSLITDLRTQKIFPRKPYAVKIAESVMTLFKSSEDGSVELFFDDSDFIYN